jgi:hypothetical protein
MHQIYDAQLAKTLVQDRQSEIRQSHRSSGTRRTTTWRMRFGRWRTTPPSEAPT